VAGRRLSVSIKHRPHHPEENNSPEHEKKKPNNEDYPRPSPTTADAPNHHDHVHNNYEDVPHKEKKGNSEKKTLEYAHWKLETTRPTREYITGHKSQNVRISQPVGKGFNV